RSARSPTPRTAPSRPATASCARPSPEHPAPGPASARPAASWTWPGAAWQGPPVTIWTFGALAAGLAALVWGADLLVKGAASTATRFGIAPVIVGLTVVAFGTSAPELAVSVSAALGDTTDV